MILSGWYQKICSFLPQQIPGPIAVLYDKVASPAIRGFHKKVALEITSTLKYGRVLDIGTGPGHLLLEIARQNSDLDLAGCDLSQKMLKIAKKITQQEKYSCSNQKLKDIDSPKISFIRGDVQDLPFSDGQFDLVVSTLSMHHWNDPIQGIRECARVTAPGGNCWIYDLRTDAPSSEHAELLSVKGLRRLILSWIFRLHGVDSQKYRTLEIDPCLDKNATFEVELYAAYLKLNIKKPLSKFKPKTIYSKDRASISDVKLPI